MTWNYRIFRHTKEIPGDTPVHTFYRLHEFYYMKQNNAYTADPITPYGETPDELIEELERMLSDAKKYRDQILEYGYEKGNNP